MTTSEPLAEIDLDIAPDRIEIALLIAQRNQAAAVADGLDVIEDIFHFQRDPAVFQERDFLGQIAAVIEIDERPQIDRGQIGESQVGAGQAAADAGCGLVLGVEPEADAIVEPATVDLELVPVEPVAEPLSRSSSSTPSRILILSSRRMV